MTQTPYHVSTEQAYWESCPDCGAKPNEPCVFLWPKGVNPDYNVNFITEGVRIKIERVGKPTRRPHNGRYNQAYHQSVRRARRAQRQDTAHLIAQSAPSPELRAVTRAHQQWDRQEWLKLALWLRRCGYIFQESD